MQVGDTPAAVAWLDELSSRRELQQNELTVNAALAEHSRTWRYRAAVTARAAGIAADGWARRAAFDAGDALGRATPLPVRAYAPRAGGGADVAAVAARKPVPRRALEQEQEGEDVEEVQGGGSSAAASP